MAAQFVRFGLITLVSDKRKNNDSAIIFTVRGSAPPGSSIGVSSDSSGSVKTHSHTFHSNTVNSVAPLRQSTESPTRVAASLVGISLPRTPLTTPLPTSAPLREVPWRVTILNSTAELPLLRGPGTGTRRSSRSPTPIGYSTSLENLHSVLASASSCATTSVRRTFRFGSRSRTSRKSSASLRVPWLLAHLVPPPRLPGRRQWNATTRR